MERPDTWDYYPLSETHIESDRKLAEMMNGAEKRPTIYKLG